MTKDLSNILALKIFCAKYPSFSMAAMRNKIFNADTNGLNKIGAILKVGKKIFIHELKFCEWIEGQNNSRK